LRHAIHTASKLHIPKSHVRRFTPSLPPTAKVLIQERDDIRTLTPTDPRITDLNTQIQASINQHNTDQWHDHLHTFNHTTNLNQTTQKQRHTTITFNNGKTYVTNKDIAHNLYKELVNFHQLTPCPEARSTKRNTHKLVPETRTHFTTEQVQTAIKQAKNSPALGPDDITMIHLKHFGPISHQHHQHIHPNQQHTSNLRKTLLSANPFALSPSHH
jgi:hypothetical protein